jgi:DNA invertase Pin-like site-specific DNA recombinase
MELAATIDFTKARARARAVTVTINHEGMSRPTFARAI